MKSIVFLSIFFWIFSLNALNLNEVTKILNNLSKEDIRFTKIINDLKEFKNGEFEVSPQEMLDDIGTNFVEIAKDSQANPQQIQILLSFFSQFLEINNRYRYNYNYKNVTDYNPPSFFERLSDSLNDLKEVLYEEIMDYDTSIGAKLFNIEIIEGINTSLKYKYQLNSDYAKGLHTRIDTWTLKNNINAGTILKNSLGKALPIYVGINSNHEIIFARHYKSKKEALKAIPKTPISLPLNAKKALKLGVGDFVSIPVKMGLNAGISLGWTQGIFSSSANTGIFLIGEFRINIYKIDDTHVRIKISGLRSQGRNGQININYGINFFGYDPKGLINIDSQIENILGTNLFKISKSKIKGQQLTIDFVFDLLNKDAQIAYNAILKNTLKFKSFEIGKEFIKENKLDEIVFGDLTLAEKIFEADKNLPPNLRRVNRIFKGSKYYNSLNKKFHIGLNIINFNSSSTYTYNRIRLIDEYNNPKYYIYPILTQNTGFSLLFGLWKEKNTRITYSFEGANPDWQPYKLYNIVFSLNTFDKYCRKSELKDYIKNIKNTLGSLNQYININNYQITNSTKNFNGYFKIAISRDGFKDLIYSCKDENFLYKCIIPIIKDFEYWDNSIDEDFGDSYNDNYILINPSWPENKKIAAKLCNEKWNGEYYWNKLVKLVNTFLEMGNQTEIEAINTLRKLYVFKESFYKEISPRFMIEIINQKSNIDNIYISLNFGGEDIPRFNQTFGSDKFSKIYHDINEIIYQITYNSDIIPR